MIYIILFIITIICGILALVFFIIGLLNNNKQQIIGSSIVLILATILFFYTIAQGFITYFKFIEKHIEKNETKKSERNNEDDFIMFEENNLNDTIHDNNNNVYVFYSNQNIRSSTGSTNLIPVYIPVKFEECMPIQLEIEEDNILILSLFHLCKPEIPDFIELINKNEILINSAIISESNHLVEEGVTKEQYIFRKTIDFDDVEYLIFKYDR